MINRIAHFYKQTTRARLEAEKFLQRIGQDDYRCEYQQRLEMQKLAMKRLLEARDNSSPANNSEVQNQIKSFKENVLALNDTELDNKTIVTELQNHVNSWECDPKYKSVFDDFLFEEFKENKNTDAYLKNLIRFATSSFPHSQELFFRILHDKSQPGSLRFLNLLKNDSKLRSNLDTKLIDFMAKRILDIKYLEKPMDCLINHMGFQDEEILAKITTKLKYHQNLLETKIKNYKPKNTISIEFQILKIQAYQKLLYIYYQLKPNSHKALQDLIQSLTPSPEAQYKIANNRTLQNALKKHLDINFISNVLGELSKKSNIDERSQDFIAFSLLLSDIIYNQEFKSSISSLLDQLYQRSSNQMTQFFWDMLDPENPYAEYLSDEWRQNIISRMAQNPCPGITNFFINQITDYEANLYSYNKKNYIASLNFHFLFQTGISSDNGQEVIFDLDKSPLLKQILKDDLIEFKTLYQRLQENCSEIELDFNSFLEYWFSEIDLKDKLLKLYTENPSLIPARNQYNPESKLEKWFESFKGGT